VAGAHSCPHTDVLRKLALNPANLEAAENLLGLVRSRELHLVIPERVDEAFRRLQDSQHKREVDAAKKHTAAFHNTLLGEVSKLLSRPDEASGFIERIGALKGFPATSQSRSA